MLGKLTPAAREALRGIGQKAGKAAGEEGARRRVAKNIGGMIGPKDTPLRQADESVDDLTYRLEDLLRFADELNLPPGAKDAVRKALTDAQAAALSGRDDAVEAAMAGQRRVPERLGRVDPDMGAEPDIDDLKQNYQKAFGQRPKTVLSSDRSTGKTDPGAYRAAMAKRLGMDE